MMGDLFLCGLNVYVDTAVYGVRVWLRCARLYRGMSQAGLGGESGVGVTSISEYERGNHVPSLENFARLAWVLGVSADSLLGFTERDLVFFTRSSERFSLLEFIWRKDVARRLREARILGGGHSRRRIMKMTGISYNSLFEYERGKTIPGIRNFYKLCYVYDASADKLLGLRER